MKRSETDTSNFQHRFEDNRGLESEFELGGVESGRNLFQTMSSRDLHESHSCAPVPSYDELGLHDFHSGLHDLVSEVVRALRSSSKGLYRIGLRSVGRDVLLQSWGRIQRQGEEEYSVVVRVVVGSTGFVQQASRASRSNREVLEEFQGVVDQIQEETAFVTLKSPSGEEFAGKYSARELKAKGIGELSRFLCRTVDTPGGVQIELEAIPDRQLTAEKEHQIEQEIEEALGNDDGPTDDY